MIVMSKASVSASSSGPEAKYSAPLLELRRAASRIVLAYHELSSDAPDYRYGLSSCQFAEHLQLAAQLQQRSGDGKPPITFSFDDGHISNYTDALPLLEEHSCKAIFFVIAGRIGEHRDFMNWAQLRELAALGHRIESHSWSHRFLIECTNSDLRDDLRRSKEALEDGLGISVNALSAPHGRWNQRVLDICEETGYRRLYTSDPWSRSSPGGSVEVVGRLIVVRAMDAVRLLNWLTMGQVETGLYRARYAMKRSAQRVLGNRLYYHLWTRFSGWKGSQDNGK